LKKKDKTSLISILASLVVLVFSLLISYQILEITDHPVMFDGHKICAFKASFESIIILFIVAIIFLFFLEKNIKNK